MESILIIAHLGKQTIEFLIIILKKMLIMIGDEICQKLEKKRAKERESFDSFTKIFMIALSESAQI